LCTAVIYKISLLQPVLGSLLTLT